MKFPKVIAQKHEKINPQKDKEEMLSQQATELSEEINVADNSSKHKTPIKSQLNKKFENKEVANMDYNIIHELVTEKFKDIRDKYFARSLSRRSCTKTLRKEDFQSLENIIRQLEFLERNEPHNETQTDFECLSINTSKASTLISTNIEESNEFYQKLLLLFDQRYQCVLQASKALSLCEATKGFRKSRERLEAERLLLISTCGFNAIKEELSNFEFDQSNAIVQEINGSIHIKDLKLILEERKKLNQWQFVLIFRKDDEIIGTEACCINENNHVRFRKDVAFGELSSDFAIDVAVYGMQYKNKDTKGYRKKFVLRKNPSQLFSSSNKFQKSSKLSTILQATAPKSTSFILLAKSKITISDLYKTQLNLENISKFTPITVTFSINHHLNILTNLSGYLNLGLENRFNRIIWKKQFFRFEGYNLSYSNDENANVIEVIDMRKCATSRVEKVSRVRTALVEVHVEFEDADGFKRYYLNFDTQKEMDVWLRSLNGVVDALRNWDMMKC